MSLAASLTRLIAARSQTVRGSASTLCASDALFPLSLWERAGVRADSESCGEVGTGFFRLRTARRIRCRSFAALTLPSPASGRGEKSGFSGCAARGAQCFELLAELPFEPALGRLVERAADKLVRQTLLIDRDAAFDAVIVLVALAV